MEHETSGEKFHDKLRHKMDEYAHLSYRITKSFPKSEIFGIVSQLRRSSLSVILNYIEGYARVRGKVYKNFLEISYGSLKESRYLFNFSFQENYIKEQDYNRAMILTDEIGAMLWTTISKIS